MYLEAFWSSTLSKNYLYLHKNTGKPENLFSSCTDVIPGGFTHRFGKWNSTLIKIQKVPPSWILKKLDLCLFSRRTSHQQMRRDASSFPQKPGGNASCPHSIMAASTFGASTDTCDNSYPESFLIQLAFKKDLMCSCVRPKNRDPYS